MIRWMKGGGGGGPRRLDLYRRRVIQKRRVAKESPSSSTSQTIRRCWQSSTIRSFSSHPRNYGVIYNPPDYPLDTSELVQSSIRCCIRGFGEEDHDEYTRDTGMSLCWLGTSAGVPTQSRSTTSTLLRMGGSSFLFDAGEGVQRQMAFTRAKPSHIERIFITHLHGDHMFGLPGFLLGLQHSIMLMQGSNGSEGKKKKNKRRQENDEEHVVKIYGPPGIYHYIASNIILSCTVFHSLSIEVYELVGGRVRRSHGAKGMRNPFSDSYPEFQYGKLKRKFLEPENGVWTIHDFDDISREDILSRTNDSLRAGKRKARIKAAELDHLPGIATFGYVVEEDDPPRNIDPQRAQELGVSPAGRKYQLLKYGFPVQTDDGSREVHPSEVCTEPTKRARKVAILGDCRGWTPQMSIIAQNADVLLHEATLMEEDWSRGHSTAAMAGCNSRKIDAKVLVLNHISSKSDRRGDNDESNQLELIREAKAGCENKSEVLVAYDFMELLIPWMGFRGENDETTTKEEEQSAEPSNSQDRFQMVKDWFAGNDSTTSSR